MLSWHRAGLCGESNSVAASPPAQPKAQNSAGWVSRKSPSPPFRGERACPGPDPGEGPRRDVGLQPTDLIRGAWEGEVGGAANPSVGPPHPALSPGRRGERREKRVLESPFRGESVAPTFPGQPCGIARVDLSCRLLLGLAQAPPWACASPALGPLFVEPEILEAPDEL